MDALANVNPLAVNALVALAALSVLDFLTGALRAIAEKTFQLALVDVWVFKQLLGRVAPIAIVLVASQFIGTLVVGDISLNVLEASALVGAATVIAASLKSITDNIRPSVEHPLPEE